jgi:RND family efflux transporter MFP subunit
MKTRTIVIVAAVAALTGLVAWRAFQRAAQPGAGGAGRSGRGGPVTVRVQPLRRDSVREIGRFTGTILPQEQFLVAPKVPGRLEWLGVAIGDEVTNGQWVAAIDGREYSQQVAQASAQLEVAQAQVGDAASALSVAEKELVRARELREQKVASQADLDSAESRYQAAVARHAIALAQVRQQQAALLADEVRLAYTRIAAAWAGNGGARVIGERFVDEGAMLRANDPIVSVLDLGTVLARVYVVERDYPKIQHGQPVTVAADAYPGRTFAGTVARKAPLVKESSRQARVEIEIPNPDRLLVPGMFVRVEIAFAEREQAVVAPVEALARRNGRDGVFLVDPESRTARFVAVDLGAIGPETAEILAPPLEGLVVTLGQHLLESGSAVRLPSDAPAAKGGPVP